MYVIMNVGTELLHRRGSGSFDTNYSSESGAKNACTRLNKQYGSNSQWVVMTVQEFNELHDPIVTVFNLMSGKAVQIRKSERGGCCDPSTERYWAM